MKIVIALASSPSQLSGVQRHAINLARCLLTRCEVSAVHLVAAPWQMGFVADAAPHGDARLHLHSASIGKSVLSRNLWFYTQLPKLAIQLDADIVHLAYPAPMPRYGFDCPVVVTLHDLYPYDIPENFGFPKVLVNRAILQQCLRRVDSISCVSQSTFSRLKNLDPQLARKAGVIYNALEPPTSHPLEIAPHWGTQPFLLCVAQHRRNKNILLALRVFDRLLQAQRIPAWTRLLIVGIPGPDTSSIKAFIAASGLTHRVVLLSGISDAQLQWCYRNCSLVLAPSVIEGFGLPVAEALLAGCRVVCSDIPAFRELDGGQCHFAPLGSNQVEAFVDAAAKALDLETPEPVALPQLSLPVIAEEYMRLYQSLLPAAVEIAGSNLTPFATASERRLSYESQRKAENIMLSKGKRNVLGILVDVVNYEAAVDFIFRAAREKRGAAISALAVHGVMTGVLSAEHKFRLNHFDLLVPDGQPVRWVLNGLHGANLPDRVRGSNLTLKVCARAAAEGESIYLYGGTCKILVALIRSLEKQFPGIRIAGAEPSKFRKMSYQEKSELASRVLESGATILLCGLGCPRQEIFAFELRNVLSMPIIAVGAAFPILAGLIPEAPSWMQERGLEWLFRLISEPRRLWRRYVYLNPAYLFLVALQAAGFLRFPTEGELPVREQLFG